MTEGKYLSQKWQISYSERALNQIKKLDSHVQLRILDFFDKKVLKSENPRVFGKQLTGKLVDFWSFRIGDYRVIANINKLEMIILAIHIGHRKDVYKLHL